MKDNLFKNLAYQQMKFDKAKFFDGLSKPQFKIWNELYRTKGVFQTIPTDFIINSIEFLKEHKVKKILDLGCGTGRHTNFFKSNGFEIVGCDASDHALRFAKIKHPDLTFLIADARSLPFPDKSFDAIICTHVIEHHLFSEIKKIVKEIERVLTDNGVVLMSTISDRDFSYNTGQKLESNTYIDLDDFADGGEIHHFFSKRELFILFKNFKTISLHHSTHKNIDSQTKKYAHWNLTLCKKV